MSRTEVENEAKIPQEEWDKPIGSGYNLPPLPLLPEREWMKGCIIDIVYQYSMFKGKRSYLQNEAKEDVLDPVSGEKIARKEFNLRIECREYMTPNNKPRVKFLRLGASVTKKARLSKVLEALDVPKNDFGDYEKVSAQYIVDNLKDKFILFQVANKEQEGKEIYQNVLWDTLKPDPDPDTVIDKTGTLAPIDDGIENGPGDHDAGMEKACDAAFPQNRGSQKVSAAQLRRFVGIALQAGYTEKKLSGVTTLLFEVDKLEDMTYNNLAELIEYIKNHPVKK